MRFTSSPRPRTTAAMCFPPHWSSIMRPSLRTWLISARRRRGTGSNEHSIAAFLDRRGDRGSGQVHAGGAAVPGLERARHRSRGDARAGRHAGGRENPGHRAQLPRRGRPADGGIAAHVRRAGGASVQSGRAKSARRPMGGMRPLHRCHLCLSGRRPAPQPRRHSPARDHGAGRAPSGSDRAAGCARAAGFAACTAAQRRHGRRSLRKRAHGILRARARRLPRACGGRTHEDRDGGCRPTRGRRGRADSRAARGSIVDFLSAETLPWLQSARTRVRAAFDAQRLPHSLLLLSNPGLGAEPLANWISALALCESQGPRPCGECASCRLLRSDSHPDSHFVRLEEDAQQIKVDQVRALIESLSLKSYRGGYKVGVIEGAESLNANGANAFLKTLEEPGSNTVLIMIARPSHRLPATIASRCLRLTLVPPPPQDAIAWLEKHLQADAGPAARGAESEAKGAARAATGRSVAPAWNAALALAGGAPLLALELDALGLGALDADMQESFRELTGGWAGVGLLVG